VGRDTPAAAATSDRVSFPGPLAATARLVAAKISSAFVVSVITAPYLYIIGSVCKGKGRSEHSPVVTRWSSGGGEDSFTAWYSQISLGRSSIRRKSCWGTPGSATTSALLGQAFQLRQLAFTLECAARLTRPAD
jgi:hypothetical protein